MYYTCIIMDTMKWQNTESNIRWYLKTQNGSADNGMRTCRGKSISKRKCRRRRSQPTRLGHSYTIQYYGPLPTLVQTCSSLLPLQRTTPKYSITTQYRDLQSHTKLDTVDTHGSIFCAPFPLRRVLQSHWGLSTLCHLSRLC